MPRTSAAAPSSPRDDILESAILLMRQSGLSGAGINQVLAHSDAPKGSMYHYFPGGKLQLVGEALERYGLRVADALNAALSSRSRPADKVRALFRSVADRFEEGKFEQSCAAGASALDLTAELADLAPLIAAIFADWRETIAKHFDTFGPSRRKAFAGLILSALEGAYVRGRAERSTTALLEAGEWLAQVAERESGPG
jgi:TetR/AcrR family transcriptional regulator, lmrAB and yxaGH operons repressor